MSQNSWSSKNIIHLSFSIIVWSYYHQVIRWKIYLVITHFQHEVLLIVPQSPKLLPTYLLNVTLFSLRVRKNIEMYSNAIKLVLGPLFLRYSWMNLQLTCCTPPLCCMYGSKTHYIINSCMCVFRRNRHAWLWCHVSFQSKQTKHKGIQVQIVFMSCEQSVCLGLLCESVKCFACNTPSVFTKIIT